MFLTHKDDVADHVVYARRFGCARVMHAADVGHGTRDIERRIDGDEPVRLASDLLVIPLPGHTRGSQELLIATRSRRRPPCPSSWPSRRVEREELA